MFWAALLLFARESLREEFISACIHMCREKELWKDALLNQLSIREKNKQPKRWLLGPYVIVLEHVHGPVATHRQPLYPHPRAYPTCQLAFRKCSKPRWGYLRLGRRGTPSTRWAQPHKESVFRACTTSYCKCYSWVSLGGGPQMNASQ